MIIVSLAQAPRSMLYCCSMNKGPPDLIDNVSHRLTLTKLASSSVLLSLYIPVTGHCGTDSLPPRTTHFRRGKKYISLSSKIYFVRSQKKNFALEKRFAPSHKSCCYNQKERPHHRSYVTNLDYITSMQQIFHLGKKCFT